MLHFLTSVARKLPMIVALLFLAATLYWFVYSGVNAGILVYASLERNVISVSYLGDPYQIGLILFVVVNIVLLFGFFYATRIQLFERYRLRKFYFIVLWLGVVLSYSWLLFKGMHTSVFPYVEKLIEEVTIDEGSFLNAFVNEGSSAYLLMMIFPLAITFVFMMGGMNIYHDHRDSIENAFREFRWRGGLLQKIGDLEQEQNAPDVKLGKNIETNEYVEQPGKDRTLNNLIVGSIGTGKTAALGLPIINQDLHHMTKYINQFPKLIQRKDYNTEDVKGRYLNGISIIEPSNDLCKKSLKLCKAHGIPDDAITYIDPTDPNTPNINPMKGPVEKVAESLAQVIEGLNESGDSGNFYFEQAQRNHLKQYVYLLKMHDEEKEVTFDMLLDMYNNSQAVRIMHEKLKERIPQHIESIEDRDEYNKWKIIQQVDEWFDMNLLPVMENKGGGVREPAKVKQGTYRGMDQYYDSKAEHVQGLRNILNDIGSNPLIRRVLFGKSDFSFDTHLELGGVLLVNTAKGEMGNLSNVLGKMVLLSLQNAVFRREPGTSPYHHILIDEAPDYLYQPFREFPAQSRKYKCIITVICQTIAQMADRYGEYYLTTLVGTLRHRMIYGDVPAFDAEYFSKMFGEDFRYEESSGEQVVSPLQESPMVRQTSNYQKVREENMSASDVMYQDAFQCAVKIVSNNRPLPVQQIKANFVPYNEFEKSRYVIKEQPLDVWMNSRRQFEEGRINQIVEDSEETLKDIETMKQVEERDSQNETVEHSFSQLELDYDDLPKPETRYQSTKAPVPLSQQFTHAEKEFSDTNETTSGVENGGGDNDTNEAPDFLDVTEINDAHVPGASSPQHHKNDTTSYSHDDTEEHHQGEQKEFQESQLPSDAEKFIESLKE